MHRKRLIIGCIFLLSQSIWAQSAYLVGSSSESIEPDHSVFSLTLAGYGAPRDGRFTITWNKVGAIEPVRTITGLNGKLYMVNERDEIREGSFSGDSVTWKTVGNNQKLMQLSSWNERLYAVNAANELLAGNSTGNSIQWARAGEAGFTIALTSLNGVLYGVNDQHELFSREIENPDAESKILGHAGNIRSLTGQNNTLYALRNDNTLWFTTLDGAELSWIKMGRFNGSTYNSNIRHITVSGNRLYGVADDGNLYVSGHSSRGDLTARAMSVKSNNKTMVIVAVDLVGLGYDFINAVKNEVYQKYRVAPEAVMVNISHTHFAPVTHEWLTWAPFNQKPDTAYMNSIRKKIIKVIGSSLQNMEPAELFFGRGKTNIGYNRSTPGKDAPYDNDVDVIRVVYKKNGKDQILFMTGCHPVFPNDQRQGYTLSANYPGIARTMIEEKTGSSHSMFLQGCGGDINPRNGDDQKTGMELALDVMSVLQQGLNKVTGALSFAMDSVVIPVEAMSKQEVVEYKNRNLNREGDVSAEKNVRWADLMLNHYKNGTVSTTMPVYVQTVNIGNWKLVGLSREVVTEYSLGIKKIWPQKWVSVAGYCNDVSSYLPAERHIVRKTYEGNDSFFWYGQHALFPADVLDIILKHIREKNL